MVLNKKEKMVISHSVVKSDFSKGYGRVSPWPRLKESNIPVIFKAMIRMPNTR